MKANSEQELINVALIEDEERRKKLAMDLFHTKKEDAKEWNFLESILENCRKVDLKLHRLENNSSSIEEIHTGPFNREHHVTFFSTVFHAFFLPKNQSCISLYIKNLKMDSLTVLRTLIEYTSFALWADCVTRFKSSLLDFLWDPNALASLDIHQMNSYDFNNRLANIRDQSKFSRLDQRDFEDKFFSRGNPTDFFLFLFKPVCNHCQTRKKRLKYLFKRAKAWNIEDLLGTTRNKKTDTKQRKKKERERERLTTSSSKNKLFAQEDIQKRKTEIEGVIPSSEISEELSYSLNSFVTSMTSAAKKHRFKPRKLKESEKLSGDKEREETRKKKLEESIAPSIKITKKQIPVFGVHHLKTCAFCQRDLSSAAILQLPSFKLVLIWLQKIFPERRRTLIKIKLAWTFLTENFSHFSTSINPYDKEASFDYHGRKINLFSLGGMSELYNDIFDLINCFLAYRERTERYYR
ncbi:MAG: hypothetical protein ACXADA_05395 [Candidatus Hodarchaeales archaeon]|jgi:hypothetical protein